MLYIKHPSDSYDRENIKELWNISFGDEDEYVEFFLKNRVKSENILVLCDDSKKGNNIVSMLFLLDAQTRIDGKLFKSAYLYAACTHPDCRGNGCMSALLKGCEKYCKEKGYSFISLVPASDSLFEFYARSGYIEAFKERCYTFKRCDVASFSAPWAQESELTASDMFKVRERMLKNKDAFLWDEKALSYALEENAAVEYESLAVSKNGEIAGYAFFYKENDNLIVRECAFEDGAFSSILRALLDSQKFEKLYIKTPADFSLQTFSRLRFNAMLLPLDESAQKEIKKITNAYLGHTLG